MKNTTTTKILDRILNAVGPGLPRNKWSLILKLKFYYNLIKTCHPLEGIFLSSIVLIVFNIIYQEGGDRVFYQSDVKEANGMF